MLTVKKWEYIRRMYFIEKKSMRQIERDTGHAWRTIHRAVSGSAPGTYKQKEARAAPIIGPFRERIEQLLTESDKLPRKQRYTAGKIYEILQKEGYRGAESTLRYAVSQARKRRKVPKLFLPLEFQAGEDAQVDWGEAVAIINGKRAKVQLFIMRLNYSRRLFVKAYPRQHLEAFLDAHVAAFHHFGGVPQRITYDNLKVAVQKILAGKKRVEQRRFLAFRGQYLFDSHFCTPGAGHEKGGVENGVGYVQRQFMSPLPEVDSYQELNRFLLERCLLDDQRQLKGQPKNIDQMWVEEKPLLSPLPFHPFDCSKQVAVTLNPYSQVVVETNRYSVPADKGQKQLQVKLYPFKVEIYRLDHTKPIAIHQRCYEKNQDIFNPLHYLSLLQQRPGALTYAKPLKKWRQQWPAIYETALTGLKEQWPDGRGVQEFVKILRLHQTYPSPQVARALAEAVKHHCLHLNGVQLFINQFRHPDPIHSRLNLTNQPQLHALGQQQVNLQNYEQLLSGGA